VSAVVFHVEGTGLVEEHVFFGIEQTVLVHVEHREDIAAAGGGLFDGHDAVPIAIPAFDEMGAGLALLGEAGAAARRAARVRGTEFHG
jgi:hypothetical protein